MATISFTDQELVKNYLNGNESAIAELINRHQQRVFAYIRMLVKETTLAEDIFQDTFVKVVHTLKSGNYNEEGKFLPWVMRIAHNLSIDHFRKAKRIQLVQPKDDEDVFRTIGNNEDTIEDKMIKSQVLKDIKRLIRELPQEQQEVLILRHYADMSFQEIAEYTDVSINTALGRMRYALINLRKIIKKNDIVISV
jgi:RNA polymerase sigma-70 factor (ECF subfamily)